MMNFARRLLFLFGFVGMANVAYAAPSPISVPTIAALQPDNISIEATVQVLGYNVAGDGGGGLFRWSPESVAAEDHCTVFKARGVAAGRFIRQLGTAPLAVEMCGAYNNNTNAAATTAAIQHALDHVASSQRPNQTILMPGPRYAINASIVKALSGNCPDIRGSGFESTTINYAPGSISPVFRFIGVSGQICAGGVRNLAITGNPNTVGCRWEGQTGSYCDIRFNAGRTPFQWCNCGRGQFTEDTIGTVDSGTTTGIKIPLGEFIVNGGDASFRGSGIGDKTRVSLQGAFPSPLLVVGPGAYLYNGKFGGVYTAHGTSGTVKLISNQSTNPVVLGGGYIDLENDPAHPIQIADTNQGAVYMSNTFGLHGSTMNIGSGVLASNVIFYRSFAIGSNGVPIVTNASQGQTAVGFSGSAGITMTPLLGLPFPAGSSQYVVSIENAAGTYRWSAYISTSGFSQIVSTCSASVISSFMATDARSWGMPSVSCSGGFPRFTNSNWPGGNANFTLTYTAHVP